MYYFHLQGPQTIVDTEGTDLPDEDAARAHAVTAAREIAFKRDHYLGHGWSAWTISVRDERNTEIFSLSMDPFARP